jgi:hypothetical protein
MEAGMDARWMPALVFLGGCKRISRSLGIGWEVEKQELGFIAMGIGSSISMAIAHGMGVSSMPASWDLAVIGLLYPYVNDTRSFPVVKRLSYPQYIANRSGFFPDADSGTKS